MTTGVLPFRGETSGVVFESILNRVPPAAVRFNPEIPPRLDEILQKALEKDREMRYQFAAEMRADLKRLRREADSSGRISASVDAQSSGSTAIPASGSAPVAVAPGSSAAVPACFRLQFVRPRSRRAAQIGAFARHTRCRRPSHRRRLRRLHVALAQNRKFLRKFHRQPGHRYRQSLSGCDFTGRKIHRQHSARRRPGKHLASQCSHQKQHPNRRAH